MWRCQIERMTDEEIIRKFPYPKSAEILAERYNNYLWRMVETAWKQAIGKEHIPLEDLFSAAKLGLVMAVKTFDPEKGVKFITYMVRVVNNHIIHEIKRHMPINIGWLDNKDESQKQEMAQVLSNMVSLDDTFASDLDDDEAPLGEKVADSEHEKEIEDMLKRWYIRQALNCLDPVERRVISLIYGLDDGEPRSVRDISTILGYTRDQIQYIHRRALKKMRKLLI